MSAFTYIEHPMGTQADCISPFDPSMTNFCVIQDLMIHDIDIVLKIVKANVSAEK